MENAVKKLDIVNGKNGLVCAFCGATKNEVSFVIGAQSREHADSKQNWCMIYGTGKMACPTCYEKASAEGVAAVDRHVAGYNGRKIYTKENDWKEFIAALDRGDICQIDEEIFYYFLEVLPPQYMDRIQDVAGVGMKRCTFGFAEGAEYVTDFWRVVKASNGVAADCEFYCKRSNRMAQLR